MQIFLCSYPIGTINFLNDVKFAEHDKLSGWLCQQIEKGTILINILYIHMTKYVLVLVCEIQKSAQ